MVKKITLAILLFCSENFISQCMLPEINYSISINNANTKLSTETENIIYDEFKKLTQVFNLSIVLKVIDYERGPCYDPINKTLIADKLFLNYVSKLSYGNERVKAILAHEFAHALQHKAGLFDIWNGGKKVDLHADFLEIGRAHV
jgi:Zn-dependent peptidase ImmA (M78 family)